MYFTVNGSLVSQEPAFSARGIPKAESCDRPATETTFLASYYPAVSVKAHKSKVTLNCGAKPFCAGSLRDLLMLLPQEAPPTLPEVYSSEEEGWSDSMSDEGDGNEDEGDGDEGGGDRGYCPDHITRLAEEEIVIPAEKPTVAVTIESARIATGSPTGSFSNSPPSLTSSSSDNEDDSKEDERDASDAQIFEGSLEDEGNNIGRFEVARRVSNASATTAHPASSPSIICSRE